MKTLKQRLEENRCKDIVVNFADCLLCKSFDGLACIRKTETDCVREWLQQKRHKKVSFVEAVENKFIDELLEELEK